MSLTDRIEGKKLGSDLLKDPVSGRGLGAKVAPKGRGLEQGVTPVGVDAVFGELQQAEKILDKPTNTETIECYSTNISDLLQDHGTTRTEAELLNPDVDLDNCYLGQEIVLKKPTVKLADMAGGDTMTDFDIMKASIPSLAESVQNDKNKPTESRGLGVPKGKVDMPPARPKYEYKGVQSVRNMHSNRFGNEWNDELFDNLSDWMIEFESDNKNIESKTKTTASGFYQVTDETGITYANRMENALQRNFIAVPQFVKDLQDGTKRMIDLSREEQQALYENNLFEQEGSDEAYLNTILQGGAGGAEAFTNYYKVRHHTEPTDALTAERLLEKRFTEKLKRIMEGQSAHLNKATAVKKRVDN